MFSVKSALDWLPPSLSNALWPVVGCGYIAPSEHVCDSKIKMIYYTYLVVRLAGVEGVIFQPPVSVLCVPFLSASNHTEVSRERGSKSSRVNLGI